MEPIRIVTQLTPDLLEQPQLRPLLGKKVEITVREAPPPPWTCEIMDFARRKGFDKYLEPLLQATQRRFPTGRIEVLLREDVEYPVVQYVVLECFVPIGD